MYILPSGAWRPFYCQYTWWLHIIINFDSVSLICKEKPVVPVFSSFLHTSIKIRFVLHRMWPKGCCDFLWCQMQCKFLSTTKHATSKTTYVKATVVFCHSLKQPCLRALLKRQKTIACNTNISKLCDDTYVIATMY